jgi:hypothetical protein
MADGRYHHQMHPVVIIQKKATFQKVIRLVFLNRLRYIRCVKKTIDSLKYNPFTVCNLNTILILMAFVPATIVAQNLSAVSQFQAKIVLSGQNNPATRSTDSAVIQITKDSLTQYLKEAGLPYDSITAITFDGDGRIWIGSKNGLWVFDGNFFREYTYKDGLYDKNIHKIFCSSEGQIWVATSSGPFALLEKHFYVFEPLKNQKILTISENVNNWFFITENGLSIFKKDKSFFEILYVQIFASMLLLTAVSVIVFLGIKHFKIHVEWKTNLIRVEQDTLLAQMNPHFIFNSLNSVQKYIMDNEKESAHNYLQMFASLMRKVLENSSQPTITLSEEIATLELYLKLESLRFDSGFDYEIFVQDDDIRHFEIPTMLLQAFVENAVWHGLMNKKSRGKIDLRFSKIDKKRILCEIEDNGIGRKKAAEYKLKDRIKYKSKGTMIVKKRIELLNLKAPKKITCETIDLEEKNTQLTGTLVRLEIPVALT